MKPLKHPETKPAKTAKPKVKLDGSRIKKFFQNLKETFKALESKRKAEREKRRAKREGRKPRIRKEPEEHLKYAKQKKVEAEKIEPPKQQLPEPLRNASLELDYILQSAPTPAETDEALKRAGDFLQMYQIESGTKDSDKNNLKTFAIIAGTVFLLSKI